MQQKAHFLIIMFLILVTTNCFIAQTLDWYEVKPDGENDRTWSVALSDNGNVVAASCPQGLFLSGNGGYTWSKVYTYGGPISMSGDGKVILCNTGVFSLSTNGGSTWTQVSPPGAGICDIVNVSHNGNVIAVQFLYDFAYISFDKGVTWKKISPTIKDLYSIALNSDGSKIIITKIDTAFISINNGDSWTILPLPSSTQVRATWRAKMSPNGNTVILWNERELFLSTNGGTSWQLKWRNTDPYSTVGIKVVDMNSNGQFIATCGFANVMYSTDWGDSWTTQPIVNTSSLWRDIAIDESGTKIIAGQAMGRVFVTGLSAYQELPWVRIQPTPDTTTAWRTIAVNPSFEYMLVARSSSKNGRIFLSTNRGTQWNELRPLGDVNYYWTNSAISSDGRTMYLLSAEYDGGLFLSKDYGSTWSDIRPDGSTYRDWWRTISLSENGNIAFVGGSKFYKSTDGGVTWVQIQLSTGSKYFDVSAISSDGSKVIVGGTYGKLFYSSDTGKTWTELTIPNVTS
ncbi:MAG: hypothetical protein N3A63_09800, partial [Bacteroidetes bacterium]|nr:hypothetical protein [Bacteroidota bacterium]